MIGLLINLLILCLVGGLIYYLFTLLPLPDPFKTIALVIIIVIFILVLLNMFLGMGPLDFHWRSPA